MTTATQVPFVDLHAQYEQIRADIDRAIRQVVEQGDFIHGSAVARFQSDFAEYVGVRHAVGVGNGGDAIELALRAFDIGPGDEVVTAANTFIATVLAISATGARPVLVDIDRQPYTIDPAAFDAAVTSRTRAIVPIHLYGQPFDVDAVLQVASRHNLVVVEDAAQAHGARVNGRRVGTFGHAAAFSFYPSKNLGAYGDGGMVVTNDDRAAEQLKLLGNYGQRVKYEHLFWGRNSRLDTLQAAILAVKLPHLERWNAARRSHAEAYRPRLSRRVRTPAVRPGVEHVFHLYVIETDRRDRLQQRLSDRGVHTGIHYPVPVHLQKAYASLGYRRGAFPATEAAAERILSLPMYADRKSTRLN